MDIDINSGIRVMELDVLIRRALQSHFFDIQPPVAVWGSIQCHLVKKTPGKLDRLMHGLHSGITSPTTRRSDKG